MDNYCKSIGEHEEINDFVLYDCWNKPGVHILVDKNMKRKTTVVAEELGFFGPIMDLLIRGTVNHMLVVNFATETKKVTKECLRGFLRKFFQDPRLRQCIDKWMNTSKFHSDYENVYRHKRSELINSQIWILKWGPCRAVSYICFYTIFSALSVVEFILQVFDCLSKFDLNPARLKLIYPPDEDIKNSQKPTFSGIGG